MSTQRKLLIVDDDSLNLGYLQLSLSKLGFMVEEAHDGIDALEKLKKYHPDHPDLILLDNIMPRMSGFEFIKVVKADPQYRHIPIVMFSSLDGMEDKIAGFELGVDDYITKPYNFAEVLARIKITLRNRELFSQVAVREARLILAEKFIGDIKNNIPDYKKSMEELDAAITFIQTADKASADKMICDVQEKTREIRAYVAELETRIEKTILDWKDLKTNEVELSTLETQMRKFFNQD